MSRKRSLGMAAQVDGIRCRPQQPAVRSKYLCRKSLIPRADPF